MRKRKINAPVAGIRQLYRDGFSVRQIEERTGWSNSYVHRLVRDIARSKRDAAILRQPAKSTHWRSSRQAARKAIERLLGRKLSTTEHVHHINHDHTDNRIENLQILNNQDHAKLHHPKNPIPRDKRPSRIAWRKQYLEDVVLISKDCLYCRTPFESSKYEDQKYCSHSCAQLAVWERRRASKT